MMKLFDIPIITTCGFPYKGGVVECQSRLCAQIQKSEFRKRKAEISMEMHLCQLSLHDVFAWFTNDIKSK